MPAYSEQVIEIQGCSTRVMRGGSGNPLLFLHGASGAPAWLPFMEELSESHDVIVPEHPGYGGSDTPAWLDNISDQAMFYLTFMEALNLENVHLVGNSLGGWIAAEVAVRNTSLLRSLTLIAPAGIHVKGVPKGDLFLWNRQQLAENLFVDQQFIDAQLSVNLGPEELKVMLKNRTTTALLSWNPRFYNPDLRKWLFRIDVPTLILWGDEDRIFPVAYAEEYQGLIPNSRLKIFPETGHLPHVEKSAEFVAEVNTFLAEAAR